MCAAHVYAGYDAAGFAVRPPWWAGTVGTEGTDTTYDHAMKRAEAYGKVDWLVTKEPLYLVTEGRATKAPGWYGLVRTDLPTADSHRFLAAVQKRYEPLQNSELFDFAEVVLGESGAEYEAAGSLKRGKIVWVLARLPGEDYVAGDKTCRYLLITNRHGAGRMSIVNTTVRVVCWNTLTMALAEKNKHTFRHTANIRGRIQLAQRAILAGEQQTKTEIEWLNKKAEQKVSPWYMQAFLKALFPGERQEQARWRIADIAASDPIGGMTKAIDGTAFGVYNAVTQYTDHEMRPKGMTNGNTRLNSLFYGQGAQLKQRASALMDQTQGFMMTEENMAVSLLDLVDPPTPQVLLDITTAERTN